MPAGGLEVQPIIVDGVLYSTTTDGKVVALERTSELLKAASSNVLRFKIDSELPAALREKARITGRIVQFPAHDALEIEQYLAQVREAGLVAHDVEIRKADLEDVFLEVMNKHSDQIGKGHP